MASAAKKPVTTAQEPLPAATLTLKPEVTEAPKPERKVIESLADAILWVKSQCPALVKNKTIGEGKFAYKAVTEDYVLQELGDLLLEARLIILPVNITLAFHQQYPSKGGTLMNDVGLVVEFLVKHAPSGETQIVTTVGEGADIGDKAMPKALTSARKAAYLQTFGIRTTLKHDPENTHSNEHPRLQRPAQAPLKPAAAPRKSMYEKALDAINACQDKAGLETCRQKIKQHKFSEQQITELEAVITKRITEVKK